MLKKLKAFIKIVRIFSNWPVWISSYLNALDYDQDYNLRTREGVKIAVADKDGFGIVNEIFCEKIYTKYVKINDYDVVIDIGANIGAFTLLAAKSAEAVKVFSYEPMPENYKRLRRNVLQNHLEKNINIFQVAVAKDNFGRKLFIGNAKGHHTTTPNRKNLAFDYTKSSVLEVPSITLMQILNDNNLDKCMFLKMDCEGAEYEILLNTPPQYLHKIDYLALEYHDGPERLEQKLTQNGFLIKTEPVNPSFGMLYATHKKA